MSKDVKQEILSALAELMELQSGGKQYFRKPFVISEKEFGIECSQFKGSLYPIYHLIGSLEESNFFDNKPQPNKSLDAMIYRLHLGSQNIYPEACIFADEKKITLTIKTEKSAKDVIKAIKFGIAAIIKEAAEIQKIKEKHKNNCIKEFHKEKVSFVFNCAADKSFVANYIVKKIDATFDKNADVSAKWSEGELDNAGAFYGVYVSRPLLIVNMVDKEKNSSKFSDFCSQDLRKIFNCPSAVVWEQGVSRDKGFNKIVIQGNPGRLVRDIVINDRGLADEVAKDMKLIIPEKAKNYRIYAPKA